MNNKYFNMKNKNSNEIRNFNTVYLFKVLLCKDNSIICIHDLGEQNIIF
jgi:hypothetical protein